MGTSVMLGIFQFDWDAYFEKAGEAIGEVIGILLLVVVIVWLIKRFRKG